MGPLLAYLLLQVALLFDALGWEVKMPKEIHGLRGSCLVIPCSFSYTSDPPKNSRRVVWYQWVSRGYPLVYDSSNAGKVIEKFRGKTDLYGSSYRGCSLLIRNLEQSHHGEKLYTWIDPENVGWRTYAFYDVTSTILVDASPRSPYISISGGERMGETITVTCSTSHTCPYSKPTITLNGIEGSDQTNDVCDTNGQCRFTRTRTGVVKAERMTIECFVRHNGGKTVSARKDKSAKCVHQQIKIEPELADVTEGIAKNFTCRVHHSCQKETPTITWNYRNMQVSTGSKTLSGLNPGTYSNIMFVGAKEDNGKNLTCTAEFSGGNTVSFVVLHVQQHQKSVENPNRDETHFQYEADVIPLITALTDSCVVIPCSFKIEKKDVSNFHVLWVTQRNDFMFHTNTGNILDSFRDRTKLLGNPNEQNCTVEINHVQTRDTGQFCFKAEKDNKKYSFNNSCVYIIIQASPNKPVMSSLPEDIEPGTRVTIKCAVNHTCSSHPPKITWSVPTSRETVSHSPMGGGVWETESAVTFSPTGYEDKDYIVCSVKFWGGKTQETKAFLSVKTHFQYEADVIPLITALTDSCVVIPCRFKIEKKDVSNLHVLWVTQRNDFIFHTNTGNILDSFKDRTKLLGNPDEQNCTVEINDVQTRDTGQFCFKAEKGKQKYSFSNSCVYIVTQASPNKPVMSSLPEDIEPETQVTIKCAVNHTCSSHPPEITWSIPTSRETVSHSPMGGGVWETESAVTFSPTGYEDKDNIVCSVKFWGRKTQETKNFLSVKRVQEVGFSPYIIVSSLFIIICILAGVFIYKRRNRINNTSTMSGSQPFSKPYMPSPKSQPKSHSDDDDYEADYINMADFNVYGNV